MSLSHRHNREFQPEKLHLPRDFSIPVIDESQPLLIEIGAGKGKHAVEYAEQHPKQQLIAIERTRTKFQAFAKIAQQKQLNNLFPIHADAIAWVVHALAPASIDAVYLLYPNPEPHNPNQQWLNMPFFEFLLSRLKEGGQIILASNIQSYIDNAESQSVNVWCLPTIKTPVPADSQRTHFEVKYLARGEACWQLTLCKPVNYKTRFDQWYYQP
ncbi:DUF938 domain-containing protein [Psychrobacter sp. I-STPA6b]|uniref:DUF938 domain-containing protein n=1 Tax=Psychrobacter sp. I-STPA6b TaxID=2585718 RepID=UPI001D0CAE39|nr:DUF938 domain-containing protein [Psychrobacter sp. I-STPA6b]